MADEIIINNVPESNYGIRLNNGDLIVIRGRAYLVASFTELNEQKNSQVCTVINLRTGGKVSAEPFNRRTDLRKLISFFKWQHEYLKAKEITVVPSDQYTIEIHIQGGCN